MNNSKLKKHTSFPTRRSFIKIGLSSSILIPLFKFSSGGEGKSSQRSGEDDAKLKEILRNYGGEFGPPPSDI